MHSLYGPPPEKRRRRGPGPVRATLRVLGLIALGTACFVALVWLEGPGEDPVDLAPFMRFEPVRMPVIDYDAMLASPAFGPLQTADIIPSSAIVPAKQQPGERRRPTIEARPLQSAGVIPR
jgi:hypothetical protein